MHGSRVDPNSGFFRITNVSWKEGSLNTLAETSIERLNHIPEVLYRLDSPDPKSLKAESQTANTLTVIKPKTLSNISTAKSFQRNPQPKALKRTMWGVFNAPMAQKRRSRMAGVSRNMLNLSLTPQVPTM